MYVIINCIGCLCRVNVILHIRYLLGNPPKVTHEPMTRTISKQLDIKLGPFTQEELDPVLRKIKIERQQGSTKCPPEV